MSLIADILARSQQPIVPQQLFASGGDHDGSMLSTLLRLVTAEKLGEFQRANGRTPAESPGAANS